MGYISKDLVLKSYFALSSLTEDHKQGQTQIVSAIRHLFAFDMYYRVNNSDCDLNIAEDRDLFVDKVKRLVNIEGDYYTTNFYTTIKPLEDCGVGSNFTSAGVVNNSKQNTTQLYDYPTRGKYPLFNVRNAVILRNTSYYKNIKHYLNTETIRAAFVVWILRNEFLSELSLEVLKKKLLSLFTTELVDSFIPKDENLMSFIDGQSLVEHRYQTGCSDILDLFQNANKITILSHQQIFYGAPGTGKSHRIKDYLENNKVPEENVFRTTFHPDSDYSSFVGAYKPTMKKKYRYDGKIKARYYEDDDLAGAKKDEVIIDKVIEYDFVPQTFLKAYIRAYQTDENVYLIIEEINRGNCAQIFGDLFQLLDRDDDGTSDYTIKADADIKMYLEDALGKNSEGIKDGELCLPSNFYIWATMNTSDQSLFPIDSAFKRRWDWEYEPIKYKNTDWVIEVGDNQYSWTSFQREVNNKIFSSTNSEDKMLGDYFVKPHDGVISEKLLLNKVLFYLWNDVCKDGDSDIFMTEDNKEVKFSDLYGDNGTNMLISMMKHIKVNLFTESEIDEEDDDNNDTTRYSINGEETNENGKPWRKGELVKHAVEIYCDKHSFEDATQVRNAWMAVNFIIPHIVETDQDRESRIKNSNDSMAEKRSREIRLSNGETIHVSTQVGDGKKRKGFSDFLTKIKTKPEWGINIQIL